MIEINFIITIYDKEDYWTYLKQILDSYTKIESNYVVCYSGNKENFSSDFRVENKLNGGRGNDHHPHSTPFVDMDYILMMGGYEILKKNNISKWVKLSVDSWMLDEEKIIQIFDFLEKEDCVYGGNVWYSHINLSTDIFFANTKNKNIFEDLKIHGNKFLDWLYYKKIPTGLENLMRYTVIPYNHAIILDREPLTFDGTRFCCPKLGWCMHHDLQKNVEFLNTFVPDGENVNIVKFLGNGIPFSFDWYLRDSGQM